MLCHLGLFFVHIAIIFELSSDWTSEELNLVFGLNPG